MAIIEDAIEADEDIDPAPKPLSEELSSSTRGILISISPLKSEAAIFVSFNLFLFYIIVI